MVYFVYPMLFDLFWTQRVHPDLPMGETLYRWTIKEYEPYERNRAWYVFMVLVGLGLVFYGILSNNFLFSLIIILAGIILFLHEHQEPLLVNFEIAELGIVVGNRFYSYDELDAFFIIYQPPEVKTLFFETKDILRPRLRIPLENDTNPLEVRHTLQTFLPEDVDRTEEPMSDMIARRWRLM